MLELYSAVILCEPTARLEVVNVTVGPDIVVVPMTVDPSRKVTDPVLPPPNVAVKVTDCRYVEGLRDEVNRISETV